jgi:hypothetical protein
VELRTKADNMKVYQLKIKATDKLKIPSDKNASDIVNKLLRESDFKDNVVESIRDSKSKMKRPSQQMLFGQAQKALKKDPGMMTAGDKDAIYKAFNLSLVNHNPQEVAAQNRFYGELKKKGYSALLDYNDKEYSSYKAKRPMIVFDLDSVKLDAVLEPSPKVIDKLHIKYNAERLRKAATSDTIGVVNRYANKTVAECQSYLDGRVKKYLGG